MKATIIGRRFSTEATYPSWDEEKRFPHFRLLAEREWEIDVPTLRDGERWLGENHPDCYMGGSVICENGDFLCLAVPCSEYGAGNYETAQARLAYARRKFGTRGRLASWNGEKWILPQGRTSDGQSYWRLIAERLAAYENTGLTPEEIVKLKGESR